MSILDWPLIAQTRRNHGLEHATVHVLSARYPGLSIVGRSMPNGIYIYGDLAAEQIQSAAAEALARLRAGESHLVIHPGCGTNLVTSGTLAGAAAFAVINVGQRRSRTRWETLPAAILATTFALLIAQPLGPFLQERITTSADMSTMEILGVWQTNAGGVPVHRIDTRS
jgi:hypothetical protein